MISPCPCCWLGLFVGCGHVIIGEKKRYIHVIVFFSGEKESIVRARVREQLAARCQCLIGDARIPWPRSKWDPSVILPTMHVSICALSVSIISDSTDLLFLLNLF